MTTKKERKAPLSELMEDMPFFRVPKFLVDKLKSARLAFVYSVLRNKRDMMYTSYEITDPDSWYYFLPGELAKYIPDANSDSIIAGQVIELKELGLIDFIITDKKYYTISDEIFQQFFEEQGDAWMHKRERFSPELLKFQMPITNKIKDVYVTYNFKDGREFKINMNWLTRRVGYMLYSNEGELITKRFPYFKVFDKNEFDLLITEDFIGYIDSTNEKGIKGSACLGYNCGKISFQYLLNNDSTDLIEDVLKPIFEMAKINPHKHI